MRLLFKQKFLSLLDSYDVYDGNNNVQFKVKGQFSFGHSFIIYNKYNEEVGALKQKIFTILPQYTIYKNKEELGTITKRISFIHPKFDVSFGGYTVEGDFFEWDYKVLKEGRHIATISKKILSLTDTYIIDVIDEEALIVLMIVLSIDSIKDRRSQHND